MAIRVGILGFAHGHVGSYCALWRQHPEWGVALTAGWDHDAARLQKATSDHGITACESVEALLEGVDAVVVSAETSLHAELVEQAANAGKAVILQKPMALTMAEADRIVAVVERTGVPFTLAWQMRVDPQNLQMKELLAGGQFGQVFQVRRRHCLGTHVWGWFPGSWHATPELNRDVWADDAAHPIDFLHWLLGVPETVTAEIVSLFDQRVPMDNGVALYRYPGGPLAEVSCSFTAVAGENTTEIICEKGVINQNYGDGPSSAVPRPADAVGLKWFLAETGQWTNSEIPSPPNQGPRISGLAEPLAEFLRGERPPIATAEEGRTSLRMVLACYVSVRTGTRVRIDDPRILEV